MRLLVTLTVALAATALLAAGCGSTEADNGPSGELGVTVAALTEGDIGDACWTLTTTNEAGVLQWSTSLCGGDFGTGASGFSYVGVCDAANPAHSISLVLDELRDASGAVIPASEYTNPCATAGACVKTASCEENADVLVSFDVVLLLDANAGFVDVAVDLDAFPCSAKLDCLDALLIDPSLPNDPPGSARSTTAVVAATCDTADCAYLYFDDLVLECDTGVAVIDASGVGPAGGVLTPTDPDGLLFAAVAYRQQGAETGNFLSVALGLTGAPNCFVTFALTSNGDAAPFVNLTTPTGQLWPVIGFDVPLTDDGGDLICANQPLGTGLGVDPFFVGPEAASTKTFTHELASSDPGCATCVPDCAGVECGPDGCGGECGECAIGDTCDAGLCVPVLGPCDPVDCDDGLACTVDECVAGQCTNTVDGGCLIDDVCWNEGEADPVNDCAVCLPAVSTTSWTPATDGTTCDDGDPGTANDVCQSGTCVGTPTATIDGPYAGDFFLFMDFLDLGGVPLDCAGPASATVDSGAGTPIVGVLDCTSPNGGPPGFEIFGAFFEGQALPEGGPASGIVSLDTTSGPIDIPWDGFVDGVLLDGFANGVVPLDLGDVFIDVQFSLVKP